MYGLAAGSGGRYSRRLAFGLGEYVGMRHGCRTVAARVREIDGRFEARRQPLVAVDGRIGERRHRLGVLEDAADVMQGEFAEAGVFVAREQRFALLPQALVGVHAGPVVAKQRLGHEGDRLVVALGHVLDDVLVQHHVVAHGHQRVEPQVDLGLARSGHFVVLFFDFQPAILHDHDHLVADVHQCVVAAAPGNSLPCGESCCRGWGTPRGRCSRCLRWNRCSNSRCGQFWSKRTSSKMKNSASGPKNAVSAMPVCFKYAVGLRAMLRGISCIRFARDRVYRIGDDAQGGDLWERIDDRRRGIQHQQHVAGFD